VDVFVNRAGVHAEIAASEIRISRRQHPNEREDEAGGLFEKLHAFLARHPLVGDQNAISSLCWSNSLNPSSALAAVNIWN